jgi:hypothetical protein
VEDVDPEADAKEYVVAKNSDVGAEDSDTCNSNAEVGVEYGCESSKFISIIGVGGGCCNSTIEESSCVMDSCVGTN